MKTLNKHLVPSVAVLLASCAAVVAGDTTNAPAPRPLSVFVDEASRGKDPFFPDSTRRNLQPAVARSNGTDAAPVVPASVYNFSLKAISGSKLRPLALINNATISVGEATEVRMGGRPVRIRCREIRDRSVLIEIDGTGEVRELKLREGI